MSNQKEKVYMIRLLKEIVASISLMLGFLLFITGLLSADSTQIAIPIICLSAGLLMFCYGLLKLGSLASNEKRVIVKENVIVIRDEKYRDLCHIPKQSDFDEIYKIIKHTEDKNETI